MSDRPYQAGHSAAIHIAASRRSDFGRRGGEFVSKMNPFSPSPGELNPLATHAPWGLMQRLSPLHECGGAGVPPHSWTRFPAPTERIRDRDAFRIRIIFVQQQNEEQGL